MKYKKIAVISDIHANNDALVETLKTIDSDNVDLTIILGDLLTYGCQPNDTLDTLINYNNKNKCIFIKGNHDQFYFDLEIKKSKFDYKLPDFVKESIYWTQQNIEHRSLLSMFDWKEKFVYKKLFFSHANPFGYGNWEYVESDEQCIKAYDSLVKMENIKVGVFGHSHRSTILRIPKNKKLIHVKPNEDYLNSEDIYLLNPGSIGQPRGTGLSFLVIEIENNLIKIILKEIKISFNNSINLIENSIMSSVTKDKIVSFLREQ